MKFIRLIPLAIPFFWLMGCLSRTEDMSNNPLFKEVMGKEFVTIVDTVPFKFIGEDAGINVKVPGTTGMPHFPELQREFPFEYYDRQILGVLSAGSIFRIVKVTSWKTFEDSGIDYTAVITSSGPFQGKEVVVTWLTEMSNSPNVPKFNSKYVSSIESVR